MQSNHPGWQAISGHCYIVPTPIGNLGDMTDRSLVILKSVDLIACEDTRVTGQLLKLFKIEKPLISYRDENEQSLANHLLLRLQSGDSIALVSDAGTPTISDPGFRLVRACRKAGIPVVPLPGPCAFITALSASGLPTDRFFFTGFMPPKSGGRRLFLERYQTADYTVVAYESCHRVERLLTDMLSILGENRVIAIARELTKKHESFYVGNIQQVQKMCLKDPIKGEYVVMIAPNDFCL
jgi:16S rRNA (cytidine1402-2'-O)-methyltransferase